MDLLQKLRHKLHQNPEISGNEIGTSKIVLQFLRNLNTDIILENIGGNGIILIFEGNNPGKNILFRCELDALPISEMNDFSHKSIFEGVSHKCGHDGHIAILCALAVKLSQNPPKLGNIILLFQPAEETGEGALAVSKDANFQNLKVDYAFALHNIPGERLGEIIIKDGTFSCAVNSIKIELTGKTSHAAEPQNGINPANAIANIVKEYSKFNQPNISEKQFCIVTPVHIMMGEKAYGVSAGQAELHFTLRSDKNAAMKKLMETLETTANNIADAENLKINISWSQEFMANENDPICADVVRNAANSLNYNLQEKQFPFSWGEDFGLITQKIPGAMFGIGAGENCPALHNPDYDFPDELIEIGSKMFYEIWNQINAQ